MADSHPFLSKRPLMSDSLSNGMGPTKRLKPGHVAFRILCHASLIGAFIGKSGASIKHLQLDTGSKIRVEDSLRPGSDDRVIIIVAPVSMAQEAAIRVFERVLEVSIEMYGEKDTTSFRVLVDSVQAGSVIGKGGKVVEKMRRESGAKIRVLLGDNLPPGVSSPDEVVEIEGNVMAVKKALLAVCGCLQESAQGDKSNIKESRSFESIPKPTTLDYCVDPPLQRTPVSLATTSPVKGKPLFEADRFMTSDSKFQQQEQVVFRILCLNDRVGGVIGRGGSIVKALQDETGASINIGPNVSDSNERLVTVTSQEDVESSYSPAQRALILIFSRSLEAAVEKGLETGLNKGSSVSARLVVPSNQAGCLLGKGGVIISQMRKETGTGITIIRGEQVPKCASEDDAVVEIAGQFVNVRDALYQVTSRLRKSLFASKQVNIPGSLTNTSVSSDPNLLERVRDPTSFGIRQSSGLSQYIDRQTTRRTGLDPLLLPHRLDNSPSPGLRTSELAAGVNMRTSVTLGRALSPPNGVELGSAMRSAIITNTAVEILVPVNSISSVYGENGNNLARIRQISGAKVDVQEALPGSRDRRIIISGTPDETQAAQSLLHAFILTGP